MNNNDNNDDNIDNVITTKFFVEFFLFNLLLMIKCPPQRNQ